MLPTITKTSFGIRFGPLWQIGDALGSIVDAILRGPNTPFGPLTFPNSQEGPTLHRLTNLETGDYLLITERDIVLSMGNTPTSKDVGNLAHRFEDYVLEPIREYVTLRLVSRYGCVLEFGNCSALLKESFMKQYLGEDSDARDIALRFTRRLQTEEAFVRKGVNDYRNLIYQLRQDQDTAAISFDYQHYFEPALDSEDGKRKSFPEFGASAIAYAEGPAFQKWLQRFLKEQQVA